MRLLFLKRCDSWDLLCVDNSICFRKFKSILGLVVVNLIWKRKITIGRGKKKEIGKDQKRNIIICLIKKKEKEKKKRKGKGKKKGKGKGKGKEKGKRKENELRAFSLTLAANPFKARS